MSSVSLKDVCLAIDKRNKTFYNSIDTEQQKKFSIWLYMMVYWLWSFYVMKKEVFK